MAALKELYSPKFYKSLTDAISGVLPSFNRQRFMSQIFNEDFANMEFKDRMRHTSCVLHAYLPSDFKKQAAIILKIAETLKSKGIGEDSLGYMFLPDYIELYGLDDFDTSVAALETLSQFVSCEFAVKPFLLEYGDRMIARMKKWSTHKSQDLQVSDITVLTPRVKIGKDLIFCFRIENSNPGKQLVRLEYAVYYNKANGELGKKVFKISEKIMDAGEVLDVERKKSFRKITTRVFYPGKHKLSVIVNGEEKEIKEFILVK